MILCTDERHDTVCTLPCRGCVSECDPEMQVEITVTDDGLRAPVHAHPAAIFMPDCRACLVAESGWLNDGTVP